MAKKYKTPGVYVEEITNFPPSVAQVETAIPAFIGYTEYAEKNGKSLLNISTRISTMLEYETYFGKAPNEDAIAVSIEDSVSIGSPIQLLNQKISVSIPTTSPYVMYYAIRMYFDNGGGPCYINSAGNYDTGSVTQAALVTGLNKLEKYDEPTLYIFPDALSISTADSYYSLINKALIQCQKLKDRFVLIDTFDNSSNALRTATSLGNEVSLLKYGAAYHPFLRTTYSFSYSEAEVVISHSVTDQTNTTSDGAYEGKNLSELADITNADFNLTLYDKIKSAIEQHYVVLPPSSAMAGIYARVDKLRGVWKAPANESVSSCIEPTEIITNEDQQDLNVHSSGKSINAIRAFTGKGVLVWGARTLAGNDNEWRYVSVRRFFNMVEESVKKATVQFVFEPNDANTWAKIRAMIENFLTLQWRAGALTGAKPDQAFYVRVGLGETITAEDILNRILNVEIGMAVVRPAEFIVLKFSHKIQES
ncbi:phage tail sheath family protein [Aequorivita echinoideorum]|uniref:Phage tail sheath subtilisin-like domain-containing protein n=1 Tax=Aequorivita echinoideorum TaxID=1549647 RepID=A0ABS5S5E7_9FLAO|nr:phage tail sheath C-terminal domain-containing protein [Aequorivita echinoideorum]MBT0608435.1 phage tail sheath subtilisin-like domain-containing protein [Aequorivita echinoideorum]